MVSALAAGDLSPRLAAAGEDLGCLVISGKERLEPKLGDGHVERRDESRDGRDQPNVTVARTQVKRHGEGTVTLVSVGDLGGFVG
jgi:hypothetical protein